MSGVPARARLRALLPVLAPLLIAGPVVCHLYAASERRFYSWDHAFYIDTVRTLADRCWQSPWDAVAYVGSTLGEDYSAVFAIPLAPFVLLFGPHRAVVLSAIYLVYFVPLVALGGLVLREVHPAWGRHAELWGGAAVLLTPQYWLTILYGYPDTCGAVLMALALLVRLRAGTQVPRLGRGVAMGAALGLAIALRRHYAYGALAFFLALACELVFEGMALARAGEPLRRWALPPLRVAAAALACVGTVRAVAPAFFARALAVAQGSPYSSWELSPLETAQSVVSAVGIIAAALGTMGWWLILLDKPTSRRPARFVLILTLAWIIVWAGKARMAAHHYPHVVPLVAAVGLGALALSARERLAGRWQKIAMAGFASFLVAVLVQRGANVSLLSFLESVGEPLLPPRFVARNDVGYQQVAELTRYLREQARPGDPILVAAASHALNYDVLRSADSELAGKGAQRLTIETPAVADSLGDLPTDNLLRAAFVVVATPAQYHLRPEQQKVVGVLVAAFTERWSVADDFERLPAAFAIPQAIDGPVVDVRVWKRVRKTSTGAALSAARAIKGFVLGENPPDAETAWVVASSPYSARVSRNRDGSSRLVGHPTRAATQPTVFASEATEAPEVEVSGVVHFMDERCVGAAIVLRPSDSVAGEQPETLAGVFAPERNDTAFRAKATGLGGRPLELIIRGPPSRPEDIDYCTLSIDGLRVSAKGVP